MLEELLIMKIVDKKIAEFKQNDKAQQPIIINNVIGSPKESYEPVAMQVDREKIETEIKNSTPMTRQQIEELIRKEQDIRKKFEEKYPKEEKE